MSDDLAQLEKIAAELMTVFDVKTPPVPVELMLQKPVNGMWEDMDITQLSGAFLSLKDRYSPRMSIARLLARHVMVSEWGKDRNTQALIGKDEDTLKAFARMIVMPKPMIDGLTSAGRNPTTMSLQFEVPEDDARLRLQEVL